MAQNEPAYTLLQSAGGYGIAVRAGEGSIRVEEITPDLAQAKRLLRLLEENTVYPENVHEILDDLLGVEIW